MIKIELTMFQNLLFKETKLGLFWSIIILTICVFVVRIINSLNSLEKKIQKLDLKKINQLSFILSFLVWGFTIILLDILGLILGLHSYFTLVILYFIFFLINMVIYKSKLRKKFNLIIEKKSIQIPISPENEKKEITEKILEIHNLKVRFYTEEGIVRAVENINLDINKNEILGLVGETGCGKSVSALSIMKLIKPPGKILNGEIIFEGEDLLKNSEKEMLDVRGNKISMIFQDPLNSLNPIFKIGEQIQEIFLLHQREEMMKLVAEYNDIVKKKSDKELILKKIIKNSKIEVNTTLSNTDSLENSIDTEQIKKLNEDITDLKIKLENVRDHKSIFQIARKRSLKMLQKVRIPDPESIIDRYPFELSGGMRQRVMIAIGLACKPRILIADEPTTALDVSIQAQILHLIKDLQNQYQTSVLIITHDLGVISDICDRVAVMYSGFIVEHGDVFTLFESPKHPYTQALLQSIPRYNKSKKKLETIPGKVPNLIYPPKGCRFHPRCKFAFDPCYSIIPKLNSVQEDYSVACHLIDNSYSHESDKISGFIKNEFKNLEENKS